MSLRQTRHLGHFPHSIISDGVGWLNWFLDNFIFLRTMYRFTSSTFSHQAAATRLYSSARSDYGLVLSTYATPTQKKHEWVIGAEFLPGYGLL